MQKMIIFTDINAVEICCCRHDSKQLFPIDVTVDTNKGDGGTQFLIQQKCCRPEIYLTQINNEKKDTPCVSLLIFTYLFLLYDRFINLVTWKTTISLEPCPNLKYTKFVNVGDTYINANDRDTLIATKTTGASQSGTLDGGPVTWTPPGVLGFARESSILGGALI
ncbi:hypothetical protein E2986_11284 [Frieseomelitta varia]|uniref:Uncharacterized protein n=1 Tax=Frieseomelitta varia TaxID=561572 RepID=A0A833W454_9HYME|nr:hypothetical protein E2986_11284 [Frieseomelitta varia]